MITLAVLGVLASVVSCYYYLLIVKVMYFDEPAPAFDPAGYDVRAMEVATGLFVVLFVFFGGPLVDAAGVAAKSLF
jgi:NADH-quinone oxidoreductase subunit N